MANRGKGEFIQVLRLMEVFPEAIVVAADYPYLPVAKVKTASACDYAILVSGRTP